MKQNYNFFQCLGCGLLSNIFKHHFQLWSSSNHSGKQDGLILVTNILILDILDVMTNITWACVAIYFQRQKSLFIFLERSLVVTGTEAHFCSTCARVGPKRYHCLPLSPRVTPWKIETSPVSPPPTPNGKEGKFNCYICSPADLRRPDPSLFFLGGFYWQGENEI